MRGRFAAVVVALLASLVPAPAPVAAADQGFVGMFDGCQTPSTHCFVPDSVTVPAGASVRWSNPSTVAHTATGDGGPSNTWSTGIVAASHVASVSFTTPGTYTYHCSIHPDMHGTVVVTAPSFYFAEGFTGGGFTETLSLLMPNQSGTAAIDYYLAGGTHSTASLALTAGKVGTVDVNQAVGANQEVSVRVTLPAAGVVERVIHFNTGTWHGSTDQVGVPAPSTEWDFAEGSTLDVFNEYLTLQNPNPTAVPVTLTYFTDGGLTPVKTFSLPATSRTTVEVFNGTTGSVMNCVPSGPAASCGVGRGIGGVSLQVKADAPIVAERPFYVNGFSFGDGVIRDGHDAFGATFPQGTWNFAEGTTLSGFKEYLALQNSTPIDATVNLNYFTNTGDTPVKTVAVKAHSRVTVEVFKGSLSAVTGCTPNGAGANCGVGPGVQGVSVQVRSKDLGPSTVPIVAERPMYMSLDFGSGTVGGAHLVLGGTSFSTLFGFAAASTMAGQNDFLTIQNANSSAATITATYYANAGPVIKTFTVAAGSRKTVEVFKSAEGAGPGLSPLGIVVSSDLPVLVEKPSYNSTMAGYGATDTVGFMASAF